MKIAICDDEEYYVHTLQQYLWDNPNYAIDTFFSSDALLAQYEKGTHYDVLFCDIVMKPYNGIELARKIREYDKDVIIVFLSSYLDYAPQGYEVDAFRYLIKPIQQETFLSLMEDICQKQQNQKKILLETTVGSILTTEESIIYIEAHNKDTLIFCENETLDAKMGLCELEQLLTKHHFFRIHRKYLVHMNHITEYDDTRLTLDNGKTLSISRRKSKDFQQAMKTFIKGEIK